MSSIEVKQPIKNKFNLLSGEEQDLQEDSDKQQLIRTCKDIKEELAGLKQESLSTFQQWVQRIYKAKMRISQLQLQDRGIEISIQPAEIQHIIHRVLIQVCQTHKALIGDQMRVMLEVQSGQYFFKIDAPTPGVGYYDNFKSEWSSNQGTKIDQSLPLHRQSVNQNYYNYCVWIIYHHYCSLSECNKQICQLAKIFRQSSENLFFNIYKQIESQRMLSEEHLYQFDRQFLPKLQPLNKSRTTLGDIKRVTEIMEQYEIIKINQLNILTITKLIPTAMPKPNHGFYNNLKQNQNVTDLYCHICQFQTAINSIINENSQNMRKYTLFLQQFRRATKILRTRLSRTSNFQKSQNDILNQIRSQRQKQVRRQVNSKLLKDQQSVELQIDKSINHQRLLQNLNTQQQYMIEKQKQCIYNLRQQQKVKKTKQQINNYNENKKKMHRKILLLHQQNDRNRKKFELTKRKIDFQFKNSKILQKVEKLQSITHISAKMTQNKVESVKFQLIVKKNQKKNQRVVKLLQNFQDDLQFSERNRLRPKVTESKSLKNNEDEVLQQIRMRTNVQRGVVQSLKSSIHNLTNAAIDRKNQFNNYLKRRKLQNHNFKINMHDDDQAQYGQMNLHEYLHKSKFENEQQDIYGEDEAYLQKMQQQLQKNQKKKKKKKNKKKKQKKEQNGLQAPQQDNNSENSNSKVGQSTQDKIDPKKQINLQVELIIKKLRNLRIEPEGRSICYQIEDDCLYAMKQRQNSILKQQLSRSQIPLSKTKDKNKRSKVK